MRESRSASWADRRPSISDVAVSAGVSRAAVSKVIRNAYGVSPLMRERVESTIAELGYRPRTAARSMRGRSFTIGFELPQLSNDFFTQVTRGAAQQLEGSPYQLILAPAMNRRLGSSLIDALVDRQVDGIIGVSPDVTPDRLDEVAREVPVVILGRHDESMRYDTVYNDDALGVSLVMEHLLGLGHRRIAHLTISRSAYDGDSIVPHAVRLREYVGFMERLGEEPDIHFCDLDEADAYRATVDMLDSGSTPSAIFAGNDTLGIGVLRALRERGLGHDDVAVVGYDGIDLAAHPLIGLTTVDQRGEEMGGIAIELLMERLNAGRTNPVHHQITPTLRLGASTPAGSGRVASA